MYIQRILSLTNLTESSFLFGCRQSGKSCLLKNTIDSDLYIDLLEYSELTRYLARPDLLYNEIESLAKNGPLIVIDEIQKAPGLLNAVHRAIESEFRAKFILTGSSARKLKRSHANMLGGRALVRHLYPFSFTEIDNSLCSLESFMQFGGIPRVCLCESIETKRELLTVYVNTYLKEEIYEESLTRNLPAFTRFLELAGFANGSVINYSGISREVGVSSRVVKDYFSILEDTLLGFMLYPYKKSHRKRMISHPKFYFVDPGVAFAIRKMLSIDLVEGTEMYGNAFEHFIITEVMKAFSYLKSEVNVSFFRTSDGVEVDLVLGKADVLVPIEIKSSRCPSRLKGLKSFLSDHDTHVAYCVCRTPRQYVEGGIIYIPWQDFIAKIYDGTLFG